MGTHDQHATRPPPPGHDPERLLLSIADHLHEHCECRPGATGGARCGSCDLRAQLRDVREQLLSWRAEGRRIGERRDDAIDNGATHLGRNAAHCDECDALSGLAGLLRAHGAQAPPTSSS